MNGILHRIEQILEAFKDIGKLSPEQLLKGQRLDPNDEDNFKQVNGRVFYQAISKIRSNDIARGDKAKGLDTLTIYNVSDYQKMRCFLGKNNSSGYCIAHGNELVSVFSSQKSSGKAIMKSAVENGAKRLDCFAIRNPETGKISGDLYKLYSKFGFSIDRSMNSGRRGEPYAITNGISDYVDSYGNVKPKDERVVIFMRR
jgi:hypothetical protein